MAKEVQFVIPKIICEDGQELWYHEPEPTKSTRMTKTFSCEVKKSSHCSTQTRPDCKQITYNECRSARQHISKYQPVTMEFLFSN